MSVCTIAGSTVMKLAEGNCTIQSTQGGNANYFAAPAVSVNFILSNPPVLTETFGALSMGVGNTTSRTFTLTNPNYFFTLTGLGFSEPLTGLAVATPNGLTGSCPPGLIAAVPGSNSIMLI